MQVQRKAKKSNDESKGRGDNRKKEPFTRKIGLPSIQQEQTETRNTLSHADKQADGILITGGSAEQHDSEVRHWREASHALLPVLPINCKHSQKVR